MNGGSACARAGIRGMSGWPSGKDGMERGQCQNVQSYDVSMKGYGVLAEDKGFIQW